MIRGLKVNLQDLFNPQGQYSYAGGLNVAGLLAWLIGGWLAACWSQYAFVIGFPAGFVAFLVPMKALVLPGHPRAVVAGAHAAYSLRRERLDWRALQVTSGAEKLPAI